MSARFGRPASVAAVIEDGTAYVAVLPPGPIHVLTGAGALIWEAAQGTDADGAVRRVASTVGLSDADVRPDVERFLDELVDLGLLERELSAP